MKASFDFRLWWYTYLTSLSVLDLAGCGLTSNQGLVFHAALSCIHSLFKTVPMGFCSLCKAKKTPNKWFTVFVNMAQKHVTCFCAMFSKFQWTATTCKFSLLYLSWHDKGVKLLVSWLLGFDSGFETNLSWRGTKAKLQQRRFIVKKKKNLPKKWINKFGYICVSWLASSSLSER